MINVLKNQNREVLLMNLKKRALCIVSAAAMLLSSVVYAADAKSGDTEYISSVELGETQEYKDYLSDPSGYTVVPRAVEYKQGGRARLQNEFPERYNTETDSGIPPEKFPEIRSQGVNGDCWAFSAAAAAEYSAILKNQKDFGSRSSLLSEYHMAASINLTNDEPYKNNTYNIDVGGNIDMAVAYMNRSAASGPVLLSAFDEEAYNDYVSSGRSDYSVLLDKDRVMTLTRSETVTDNYEGSSKLEFEVKNIGTDTEPSYVADGVKYYKSIDRINAIKQAVMDYGAVSTAYLAYESNPDTHRYTDYYNPDTGAYCLPWSDLLSGTVFDGNRVNLSVSGGEPEYSFETVTNHAVTIVGWDDNYSYENFKTTPVSYDGSSFTPENGAWIVRNSWGEDYGNAGYEYISYMDPSIGFSVTGLEFSDYVYDDIECYDTVGVTGGLGLANNFGLAYVFSRFSTDSDTEYVKAVGTYVLSAGDTMEFMIGRSRGLNDSIEDEEFEENKLKFIDPYTGETVDSVTAGKTGYVVLQLAEPVRVSGDYDVFIRYSNSETEDESYVYRIPLCGESNVNCYEATEGVSYFSSQKRRDEYGGWVDIGRYYDANFCIKVYTDETEEDASPTASPTAEPAESPGPTGTPTAEPAETPEPTGTPTAEPAETPGPTGTPTAEPAETPGPTGTPTAEPAETPEPSDAPKFEVAAADIDGESMSVTVRRSDESVTDAEVYIGIYNDDGVLIGFEKYVPVFGDDETCVIEGVDISALGARSASVFVWSGGTFMPYSEYLPVQLK